jgi:hypothetical protein
MRRFKAHRLWRHPPAFLGRRGAVLLILGIAWVLQGARVAVRPYSPPEHLHEMLPGWLRVGMWVVAGGIAVYAAFRRHPGQDTPGFVALMVPLGIRAFSYVWGSFTWLFTEQGSAVAALDATLWIVLVVLVVTIAGWAEPRPQGDP